MFKVKFNFYKFLFVNVRYSRYEDIPDEVINESLSLIDKGLRNHEITEVLGINNYYLSKIRERHGRLKSGGNNPVYTEDMKQRMIDLLREGHTSFEISRILGVKVGTLRAWRRREIDKGNNLPMFEKAPIPPPPVNTKYSDEEIIELIVLNPGFGLDRMVKILYPKAKNIGEIRFRITELLNEFKEFTGEDLYGLIQSPDFSTLVTESEYMEITGQSRVPRGHGRATGGRPSKTSDTYGKGVRKIKQNRDIPLPPQTFNWGPYRLKD